MFNEAVMTAVAFAAMDAAVALKLAERAPAGIVMAEGTVSDGCPLESATVEPPLGAAESSVTVQAPEPPELSEGGVQVTPPRAVGTTSVIEFDNEAPFHVAVMSAVLFAVRVLAVASKLAVVAPAGTVTDAGTVKEELLLESATVTPPLGAASLSETLQLALSPESRVAGLHVKPVRPLGEIRLTELLNEPPLQKAVMTAVALDVMAPAEAVKLAVVAPSATKTALGTLSQVLLLASEIVAPPAGAAALSTTAQLLLAPEASVAGVQFSPERTTGATRFRE